MSDKKTEANVELNPDEQIPTVDDTVSAESETVNESKSEEKTEERDLEALLAAALEDAAKQKETALRTMAEMENLRRRTRSDVESAHKFALSKFVDSLIPVVDAMEMGIDAACKDDANVDSLKEGLEMSFKQFIDALQKFDVERLNPAGEKFNPKLHEAMTMVPSPDHESQMIIDVFQKGYVLNERLIRPARVIVAQ